MKLDRENLIENLKEHKLLVTFTKVDGESREMFCTLKESYLPREERKVAKKAPKDYENLIVVWDLDQEGWRSFHLDTITAVVQSDD